MVTACLQTSHLLYRFQSRLHKEEVNRSERAEKKTQRAAETVQGQHQRETITKSKKFLGVPGYVEGREGCGATHPAQQSPKRCFQDISMWLQKPDKTLRWSKYWCCSYFLISIVAHAWPSSRDFHTIRCSELLHIPTGSPSSAGRGERWALLFFCPQPAARKIKYEILPQENLVERGKRLRAGWEMKNFNQGPKEPSAEGCWPPRLAWSNNGCECSASQRSLTSCPKKKHFSCPWI